MNRKSCLQITCMVALIFTIVFAGLPIGLLHGTLNKAELLLRFRPGVGKGSQERILKSSGLAVVDEIPQIGVLVVSVSLDALPQVKSLLSSNDMVDFVEDNCQVCPAVYSAIPNDQYYGFQWHLTKIGAPDAWNFSLGDSNIVIAILDSGADPNHPDLAARLLAGWNFYNNNANTTDVSGHGTPVAGVAAAITNNTVGVASIAWKSSILPVRITDSNGYTSYSLMANGLVYAADRGAKVAVVSFGIFGGSALSSAAKYFMDKGGLVFAAGGNTGKYVSDSDNPYIISVSGTTSSDQNWGSYGPYIDLSAPCSAIYTTTKGGGYGNVGGTSFSAPLAAGLAALMFSVNRSLTPNQVEHILECTAVDLGEPGYDIYHGWGRVNASAALRASVDPSPSIPTDSVPPQVAIDYPSDGTSVSAGVTVEVQATDNVCVSRVELYIDGKLFAVDSDSPYEFYWDTTSYVDGVHTLTAKAYDSSNNTGESKPLSVKVSNTVGNAPPTVTINYPLDGSQVSGQLEISVSATDDSGVNKVEFYIDGRLKGTVYAAPYVYRWSSKSVKDGWHTISVNAYDYSGNCAEASVRVYVSRK